MERNGKNEIERKKENWNGVMTTLQVTSADVSLTNHLTLTRFPLLSDEDVYSNTHKRYHLKFHTHSNEYAQWTPRKLQSANQPILCTHFS